LVARHGVHHDMVVRQMQSSSQNVEEVFR
jgi:hypothetical protein